MVFFVAEFEKLYYNLINGPVAQLGERTVRIRKVESSILFVSTMQKNGLTMRLSRFFISQEKTQKRGKKHFVSSFVSSRVSRLL